VSTDTNTAVDNPDAEPADDLIVQPKPEFALSAELEDQASKIDAIVENCGLVAAGEVETFGRALRLARGMNQLREVMSGPILQELMALKGNVLGFRTDRDKLSEEDLRKGKRPYDDDEIRDALCVGLLKGAHATNDEINVIGGNCYLTKSYYTRRILELPELTELAVLPGAIMFNSDGSVAYVTIEASWKYRGVADRILRTRGKDEKGIDYDHRIQIRVNRGQGPDAVLGKAEKKVLAAIWRLVTGRRLEQDADFDPPHDDSVVDAPSTQGSESQIVPDNRGTYSQDVTESDEFGEGNPHYEVLMQYGQMLDLAPESERPIVAAGKARAWARDKAKGAPPAVIFKIDEMHDECVKLLRERKRAPVENQAQGANKQ